MPVHLGLVFPKLSKLRKLQEGGLSIQQLQVAHYAKICVAPQELQDGTIDFWIPV
eukprot:CAMPEP_0173441838 /NCGR_PEP_ID=MMETSP1357-20121228/24170_1 /TAXON_ID=77926 /ORGANISM="Hemiselmis rufescens, Strain PCC563" /LENGTH=54 /DNA_ID=CAMNT_0014407445 /DNA_START=558 /DNA_END=722 /DNA_ORIENTATION=+